MVREDGSDTVALAAIVCPDGFDGNSLLEVFARRLMARGANVRGLVQQRARQNDLCAGDVFLMELGCPQTYRISQNLGSGSSCCSIDTAGMADASCVLRQALEASLDLLVVNKFGKLEAEGQGFADEILTAASDGVVVLTTVSERHLDAWRQFSGGLALEIPPDMVALETWWAARAAMKVGAA